MGRLLTPKESATELRVHVGTLRRWAKAGKIAAVRTPGGQRRYDEGDVAALRDGVPLPSRKQRPAPRTAPSASAAASRVAAARNPSPLRVDDPGLSAGREGATPTTGTPFPWAVVLAAQAQQLRENEAIWARQRETAQRLQETQRIEALKAYGRTLAARAPVEWQATVTRDLEGYVAPEQFPPTLASGAARTYVQARVEKILAPWRKADEDRQRVATLIAAGQRYANRQTATWDWEARTAARKEAYRALTEEVEPDWSERDVEELVDDVLGELVADGEDG